MRSIQWLFAVSAALFVCAIAFIVAAERTTRQAPPPAASTPALTPVASIQQIMNAIVLPNATVVYDAVGSVTTTAGTVETAPKTDEEWAKVAASAAAVAEAGNLMLVGDRALDEGEWMRLTRAFIDAANLTLAAATRKDTNGIFMTGGDLNETCDRCHARYRR